MRHCKAIWWTVLVQLVPMACPSLQAFPLWIDGAHEIGTHGSLRLNGTTLPKQAASCFSAPGAGARYRLGNECDNLLELGGYYRYQAGKSGSYFHIEREFEAKWPDNVPLRYTGILQSYVEAGNIADSSVDFWIGQRKNKRRKIYINDYYYMNLKGKGLGVRDVPVGPAMFAYTYLRSYQIPAVNGLAATDRVLQSSHDFSFYGFSGKPDGPLMLDFRYSQIEGNSFAGTGIPVTIHGVKGWAFAAQYEQEGLFGGSNKAVIQYGRGAARAAWSKPGESGSVLGKLITAGKAVDLEAAVTLRLLDYQLIETNSWAFMGDVIAEKQDARKFDATDQVWFSMGARAIYFINEHWQVSGEAGGDRVNSANGKGNLLKQTLAMEWVRSPGFFSKPLLRAYVTHAGWSGSFLGQTGGTPYAQDTQAWSGGVQMEAKW